MNVIRASSPDTKILVPLGDLHIGAKNCDKDAVRETIRRAKEENAWVVLMGDLIENSTRDSVGDGVYQQEIAPQQQMEEIRELLQPIAPQILGVLSGNHEYRTLKQSGIDLSAILAQALGVPYLGYSGFLVLSVGPHEYIVAARHGEGSASTPETKMRLCKRTYANVGAHCYLFGHVHELAHATDYLLMPDEKIERHYVLTGSYLTYDGSYAEMMGLSPGRTGSPRITLSGSPNFAISVEL